MKTGFVLLTAFMLCYLAIGYIRADVRSFSEISKRNMMIKKQRYEAARKNAILFRDAERKAK